LEQVHVRFLGGRGLRRKLIAGLALSLAVPALTVFAQDAAIQPTQTTLSVEMQDHAGRSRAALEVSVIGEDSLPAGGAVVIEDANKQIAGAALNTDGRARFAIDLAAGEHSLRAVYLGDTAHRGSVSETTGVHALAAASPDFSISVSPAKLSLPLGESGSVTAAIKPENNSALSSPMFVTLSCSGLPDESSCTFTPENIEILPTSCPNPSASTCPINSTMVIETQLGTGSLAHPKSSGSGGAISLALLLPGALGLVALARRRRNWLGNLSVVVLLGAVSTLGATACNSRYNYFHHGPPHNPPTPAGTYTLTVSAQSNNGVTAITRTTTMTLTVQ
jgi:hypothetical protein